MLDLVGSSRWTREIWLSWSQGTELGEGLQIVKLEVLCESRRINIDLFALCSKICWLAH